MMLLIIFMITRKQMVFFSFTSIGASVFFFRKEFIFVFLVMLIFKLLPFLCLITTSVVKVQENVTLNSLTVCYLLCRTKTFPEVNFLSYRDRKRILVSVFLPLCHSVVVI